METYLNTYLYYYYTLEESIYENKCPEEQKAFQDAEFKLSGSFPLNMMQIYKENGIDKLMSENSPWFDKNIFELNENHKPDLWTKP